MATVTESVRTGSRRGAGLSRTRSTLAPRAFYWIVWPAVILFAAFHTLPVIIGVFFSFTNYAGYGEWDFVGIANYANIFRDDRVLKAYGFSFLFAMPTKSLSLIHI